MSSRVNRAATPELDYEDEYRKLQVKFNDVKKERADQDDKIKQLSTKLRKLEGDFNSLTTRSVGSVPVPSKNRTDKEEANLIESYMNENAKLKNQVASLTEKNKQLVEQLKKKDREMVVYRKVAAQYKQKSLIASKENIPTLNGELEIKPAPNPGTSATIGIKRSNNDAVTGGSNTVTTTTTVVNNDSNLLELARTLKARLKAAEAQLQQYRDESNKGPKLGSGSNAEEQLRDANWKLQQLQTQYDYLIAKTSAQGHAYKSSEEQIDDYSHKIRELRRTLEELKHEKDISDSKASRVDDLEELVRELRSANRSLEDKLSRLCETWGADSAGLLAQNDGRSRNEDALRDREELFTKVNLLQDSIRTKHAALESLRQQAEKLRIEKEEAVRRADDMKSKLEEINSSTTLLQNKLRLYSGDDGIDLEALERALTLVKRRSQALEKLNFLEDPDGGDGSMTLPIIKRKLEEVQVMNLKLTEEVERLESMLKLQSSINRDLHQELESLVHKRDKDKREIIQQAEDFEELALRRLETIHKLEAQVRELTYGVAKKGKSSNKDKVKRVDNQLDLTADTSTLNGDADNALLSDLIDEKGGEAPLPFENLMEVWVKNATIKDGIVNTGSATFVVIDFFDYESQTTALKYGSSPNWDFAATFKVNIDDFLLRYFATDSVTLELNMASQGNYTMLGRCCIPLASLVKSKPNIHLKSHPMLSVNTGEVIGHISVDIKLALPVTELYRLFLERHPTERLQIEELVSKRTTDSITAMERAKIVDQMRTAKGVDEDESRLYNEIEITIIKASGLPVSSDGKPPHSYIHFQLLGHPDKFTNPQPNNTDPVFNEQFTFPIITNEQQLRLLGRSKLELSIMDMKGEEGGDSKNNDDDEGLIGEVAITLFDYSLGNKVHDKFSIINKKLGNKKVGEIEISIKWRYPYRKQRELGPRALSGVEVETLIASFSSGNITEGIIDYKSFCRFIDPPSDVRAIMEKLRSFANRLSAKENRSVRSIFSLFNDSANTKTAGHGISDDSFIEKVLLLQLDGVSPTEIKSLFIFIDLDEDGYITLDQFLAVLNLDDTDAAISPVLHEKLKERSRDLETRGIAPLRMFKDADQWGPGGLVTRMEFKGVLKRMGFHLVDEPEPVSVASSVPTQPLRLLTDEEILNDTIGSNDEILIADNNDEGDTQRPSKAVRKDEISKQREVFEERKLELVQRSQQAQQLYSGGSSAPSSRLVSPAKPSVSIDPYDNNALHREGVVKMGVSTSIQSLDKVEMDKEATKLQASFRGYQARKNSFDGQSSVEGIAIPRNVESVPIAIAPADILVAEDTIRVCLSALQGIRPVPNILGVFQTVDTKRTGHVNRKQFAHVLKQLSNDIKLSPIELRACMDFFDASGNGSEIDYNAFVKMCKYQRIADNTQATTMLGYDKIDKMIFSNAMINKFRAYDASGNGYIRRAEMLRITNEIGYGSIANSVMLSIYDLFETRVDGQVNYYNFFEYVRENSISKALDVLTNEFYKLLKGNSGDVNETTVKVFFKQLDRDDTGVINIPSFRSFIESCNLLACVPSVHLDRVKELVTALYYSIDKDGKSIRYNDLVAFIRSHPNDLMANQSLYPSLSIAEIQRKTNKFMMAIASLSPTKLDEIVQSYLMYDWHRTPTNLLPEPIFIQATRRCGFPLTTSELRKLSAEFGNSAGRDGIRRVNYRKFLAWATPGNSSMSLASTSVNELVGAGSRTPSSIIKHLERALQRGDDLLSVFGRFDTVRTGRITADDFCAGLSDIGLSSATIKDVIEVADRFKAAAGDFILYRKVVTELLKSIDDATGAADIDIIDVIRLALVRNKTNTRRLRDMFEFYDPKNSGRVKEDDIGTIFDEANIKLKRQEIVAVCDKFCIGGTSGLVQYGPLLSAVDIRMGEKDVINKSIPGLKIDEELVAKIRELIETWILKGKDYRGELDKFDDNFTGTILQADFRDVMQDRLRSALSVKELESIERYYRDSNDPRRVNHSKFIAEMHPHRTGSDAGGHDMYAVIEDLRQKIRRRCDYLSVGELHRPYRHFARRKGDNNVTKEDLAVAVKDLGIRLASDQELYLFDMINLSSDSRFFTYNDFVVFVSDPNHQDVIWKLRRVISRNRISDKELINSLNDKDTNRSGLLTSKQFTNALSACNIDMSDADIARLMLRFDSNDAQRFDIEKFARFLSNSSGTSSNSRNSREGGVAVDASVDRDVETDAWNSLRRRINAKLDSGYSKSEVYQYFDRDSNGGPIDVIAFQQGAREVGCILSRTEAKAVVRRMTLLVGSINKTTFFELFGSSESRDDRNRVSREGDDRRDSRDRDSRDRDSRDRDSRDRDSRDRDSRDRQSRDRDDRRDGDRSSRSEYDDDYDRRRGRARDKEQSLVDINAVYRRRPDLLSEILKNFDRINDLHQVNIDDLHNDLKKADSVRVGYLERNEFIRALNKFGFKLSTAHERDLVDTLGEGMEGINYSDFIKVTKSMMASTTTADDVLEIVSRRVSRHSSVADIERSCSKCDMNNDGIVSLYDLESAMSKLGVPLSSDESKRILTKFTSNYSNSAGSMINYRQFIKYLSVGTSGSDSRPASRNGSRPSRVPLTRFEKDIMDRMKRHLDDHIGTGSNAPRRIKDAFSDMDLDGDGKIVKKEFEKALKSLRVDHTTKELDALFDYIDDDKSGSIDYDEFLDLLGYNIGSRPLRQPLTRFEKDIIDRMKRHLDDHIGTGSNAPRRIKDAFSDMDLDGDGKIVKKEFEKALKSLRVDYTTKELDAVFDYIDDDKSGSIDYDEFLDLLGYNIGSLSTAGESKRSY